MPSAFAALRREIVDLAGGGGGGGSHDVAFVTVIFEDGRPAALLAPVVATLIGGAEKLAGHTSAKPPLVPAWGCSFWCSPSCC